MKYNELPEAPMDEVMIANKEWPGFSAAHPDAINATIGVIVEPDGPAEWRPQTVIDELRYSAALIAKNKIYGYQPPAGNAEFLRRAQEFAFGDTVEDVIGYQVGGGTKTLKVAKDSLEMLVPKPVTGKPSLLLDPGWPNYPNVFGSAFDITSYEHVVAETGDYNHQASINMLETAPENATALFQVCGYNTDGVGRSQAQWDELLELAQLRDMPVILDAAYVGLDQSLEQDLYPARRAAELGLMTFLGLSFSKNMGLYNERLGALLIVNAGQRLGANNAALLRDNISKRFVRGDYSSPPLVVAHAAAQVLGLQFRRYERELEATRLRLVANRQLLASVVGDQFPIVAKGGGLFTKLLAEGFTPAQQNVLASEGIHALPSSRINIGGLHADQIERVGQSLLKALSIEA